MKETYFITYFFRRKKMSKENLEKFCVSVVDSLYSDLPKDQFFICALQAKNANVYLRIKK